MWVIGWRGKINHEKMKIDHDLSRFFHCNLIHDHIGFWKGYLSERWLCLLMNQKGMEWRWFIWYGLTCSHGLVTNGRAHLMDRVRTRGDRCDKIFITRIKSIQKVRDIFFFKMGSTGNSKCIDQHLYYAKVFCNWLLPYLEIGKLKPNLVFLCLRVRVEHGL